MLSNVWNIDNHREKNQEMPNPMQRGAKVFSNLKIFKAAKRTLPWPHQYVSVKVCCLWIGWHACVRDVFCARCVFCMNCVCFCMNCVCFAWIVRVLHELCVYCMNCVFLHELCPIWELVVKVVFVKDWREVSVVWRWCECEVSVCRRLCVVSMQHQDGRACSLYKDTRHCTIYNTCCMMFNPIYKTAYYTMCSQYAYSLYKDRTIYDTTYQTTHHTMFNPIYKTMYNPQDRVLHNV